MLLFAHKLLMIWYLIGPVVALALAGVSAWRSRRPLPLLSWLMTAITACVLGGVLVFIYALAVGGRMIFSQAVLAAYFGAGLLFLLKGLDYGLRWGGDKLFRVGPKQDPPHPYRRGGAFAVRVILLFALGLPYVMTAVMTYRPKVAPVDPPHHTFEAVTFTAADGVHLSGWWIPADPAPADAPEIWGKRTLLLCHGLAANKSNQIAMGAWGPGAGYNVLTFDFRAHGHSGGQLTTFGDTERRDVLAAVGWLKQNRPEGSEKIFGIGASMGAAALIAAAADDSAEGHAIDAVVVYGTFARLDGLTDAITKEHFAWPLGAILQRVALPLASLQTGRPLVNFAPEEMIASIWPRPVMILHGLRDEIIPFEQGEQLAREALQPRRFRPVDRAGHNDIIENPAIADEVRQFLETAKPLPVI